MPDLDHADHWRFAVIQARHRLRHLAWGFDVATELHGGNFVGVEDPSTLLAVIEGFLNEKEWLLGGEITELEEIQRAIQQEIAPAYESGQDAAHQRWIGAPPEERARLAQLESEGVIAEARKLLPSNLSMSAASWFLEGFCRRWWKVEWTEYILAEGGAESSSNPG